MSASAMRFQDELFDDASIEDLEQRPIVGAHADYRPEDFIFRRTQSRAMQETPWGPRLSPMRSWSELAGMGLTTAVVGAAIVIGTVALI